MGNYQLKFRPRIEKEVFKRIWHFAGGMLLISLVASLNTQMDKLAISKLLPVESLGYYTLAVSLAMGIIVLVNPISAALLPRFTSLYSSGKTGDAVALFHKVNFFVAILVFSVMATMSFFAETLIWIWTGKVDLAENASLFLPFIAISVAMLSLTTIPYNIAIANGYTRLNNILGVLSLIFTIPGYWIFTKYYGAIGAAFVYCIVQTIITLIYIYSINAKFLKEKKYTRLFIHQMLLPFIITLSIAFVFSQISDWAQSSRIISLIWIVVVTVTTFAVTVLIIVPLNEVRKLFDLTPFSRKRTYQ